MPILWLRFCSISTSVAARQHIAPQAYRIRSIYRKFAEFISHGAMPLGCKLFQDRSARPGGRALHGCRIYLQFRFPSTFPWGNSPWRGKCHEVTKGGRLRLEERGTTKWWMRETYTTIFMGQDAHFMLCKFAVSHGRSKPLPYVAQSANHGEAVHIIAKGVYHHAKRGCFPPLQRCRIYLRFRLPPLCKGRGTTKWWRDCYFPPQAPSL